jgi:hypothetical protein
MKNGMGVSVMSYVSNQNTGAAQAVPEIRETTGAGPITTTPTTANSATYSYTRRRVSIRSRLERVGFWLIVAAAAVVLLLLLKVTIPVLVGAAITGGYLGGFAGLLTLMNLSRASNWGNTVLGRKIFPVITAPDAQVRRLASVNAGLTFAFAFIYSVLASFIGGFLSGLIVFGALVAAAIFYNRVRPVIIRP